MGGTSSNGANPKTTSVKQSAEDGWVRLVPRMRGKCTSMCISPDSDGGWTQRRVEYVVGYTSAGLSVFSTARRYLLLHLQFTLSEQNVCYHCGTILYHTMS